MPPDDMPSALLAKMLTIRPDGKVVYDDILVGRFDAGHLTLDLGWLKAAGVKVTIKADPDLDRVRGGIVLER